MVSILNESLDYLCHHILFVGLPETGQGLESRCLHNSSMNGEDDWGTCVLNNKLWKKQ